MTLSAALAVFDEAALAALANKGLVRRAARDVEEGKVAVLEQEAEAATVAADGESVHIDARGPAFATCSCPAPGICRHRIAAVLLLRREPERVEASPAESLAALIDEIAALSEAELVRFAGKAGWRAAIEIADGGAEIAVEGAALVVRLAAEDMEVRYLPGLGAAGMVSKASPAKARPLHAAALIAVRRQAGIETSPASPAVEPAAARTIDPAFLHEVRAALAEACSTALSLAPLALEERLLTLSVSSRADALPRLGAALRGIARMVRERRERSFRFDPDRCLGRIAEADALARALAFPGEPARMATLAGSVRKRFVEVGSLQLCGLGAETWRAEGGARGVTAFLYAPQKDLWFTLSLARGAGQDPSWMPRRAFASEAVLGDRPLSALANARFILETAAASPEGRLSAAASGAVTIIGSSTSSTGWKCVFSNWQALEARLVGRLTGGILSPAPADELAVLQPRRTAAPQFDDLRQRLCWPVQDEHGKWIELGIDHDPERSDQPEPATIMRAGFTGAIVVAARIGTATFELRPVAVLDNGDVRSLDFAPVAPTVPTRSFAKLWRRARGSRLPFVAVRRSATSLLLERAVSELTGIAETSSHGSGQRLRPFAAGVREHGLELLGTALDMLDDQPASSSALLATRYIADRLRNRLTPLPWLEPQ